MSKLPKLTKIYFESQEKIPPFFSVIHGLTSSGPRDLVDDGVQLEVGVLPDAPGLVPGGAARRHGPRRREGQQAARVGTRTGRLDESQDAGGGQQKEDCLRGEMPSRTCGVMLKLSLILERLIENCP